MNVQFNVQCSILNMMKQPKPEIWNLLFHHSAAACRLHHGVLKEGFKKQILILVHPGNEYLDEDQDFEKTNSTQGTQGFTGFIQIDSFGSFVSAYAQVRNKLTKFREV
ncbi:MAG: hypothetical protein GXP52_06800 [Deltaproteobacteria bacterium]|nr:hypothetical protein [Deltaproteobacteria bacterium]